MARKSKYEAPVSRLWRAGLYIRLSREDGDGAESESVINQQALLEDYLRQRPEIQIAERYIDDGWSGTSFDRPGFQRMMADLRAGKINCVAVKDLSRLGRNTGQTSRYLEEIFPRLGVRFLAADDRLDSFLRPEEFDSILVSFRNMLNDEYCRDISRKSRSALTVKRKNGLFIGSFAPYGYQKDPADHNHLVVDEAAADVVRDIYRRFLSGGTVLGIARELNSRGIPNPSTYKRRQGMNYRHPQLAKSDGAWPDSSVRRILTNPLYTGTLVQGRVRNFSYKIQRPVSVAPEDWIVVPDTHEAIIPQEQFDRVQARLRRDTRAAPGSGQVYLFAGFLQCAECGRAMVRKTVPGKPYGYYVCGTFKKGIGCTKHTIRTDRLESAVLGTIRDQIALAVEMDTLLRAEPTQPKYSARLRRLEQERQRIEALKLSLYPDWKEGMLTREEYLRLRDDFDRQTEALDGETARLRAEQAAPQRYNDCLETFRTHRNVTALTRELLTELVDTVLVHEGGDLTIRFRYADIFQETLRQLRETDENVTDTEAVNP